VNTSRWLVFVGLLFLVVRPSVADDSAAIAEIKRFGGKVTVDEKSPDKLVLSVEFNSIPSPFNSLRITDDGLAALEGLSHLQSLDLSHAQITDAGLEHLSGLTRLQSLNLWNTQITDAGLVHLGGLIALRSLNLSNNKLTDAGLAHLQGLTRLQSLNLSGVQVTDAGTKHLRRLPVEPHRWS
jgi:Leucine-rich repeat (LRR) protein